MFGSYPLLLWGADSGGTTPPTSAAWTATGQAAAAFAGASVVAAALTATGSAAGSFVGASVAATALSATGSAVVDFNAPIVHSGDWTAAGTAAPATFRSANGGGTYSLTLLGAGL